MATIDLNIVDRSFTQSFIIDRILDDNGIDRESLINVDAKIKEEKQIIEEEAKRKKEKDFYEKLDKNALEFIGFVTKCRKGSIIREF